MPTQELVEYFFYTLLRTQGEETTEERSTASAVPVAEVPNIMRALGYYPTEQVGTTQHLSSRAESEGEQSIRGVLHLFAKWLWILLAK